MSKSKTAEKQANVPFVGCGKCTASLKKIGGATSIELSIETPIRESKRMTCAIFRTLNAASRAASDVAAETDEQIEAEFTKLKQQAIIA